MLLCLCFSSVNAKMGLLMNIFQWIYSCKKLIIHRWIFRVGSHLYSAGQQLEPFSHETIRITLTSWQLCTVRRTNLAAEGATPPLETGKQKQQQAVFPHLKV